MHTQIKMVIVYRKTSFQDFLSTISNNYQIWLKNDNKYSEVKTFLIKRIFNLKYVSFVFYGTNQMLIYTIIFCVGIEKG